MLKAESFVDAQKLAATLNGVVASIVPEHRIAD
jgi:hypothetical protein